MGTPLPDRRVFYRNPTGFQIQVGKPAMIVPIEYGKDNAEVKIRATSRVKAVDYRTGVFVTESAVYIPEINPQ